MMTKLARRLLSGCAATALVRFGSLFSCKASIKVMYRDSSLSLVSLCFLKRMMPRLDAVEFRRLQSCVGADSHRVQRKMAEDAMGAMGAEDDED